MSVVIKRVPTCIGKVPGMPPTIETVIVEDSFNDLNGLEKEKLQPLLSAVWDFLYNNQTALKITYRDYRKYKGGQTIFNLPNPMPIGSAGEHWPDAVVSENNDAFYPGEKIARHLRDILKRAKDLELDYSRINQELAALGFDAL